MAMYCNFNKFHCSNNNLSVAVVAISKFLLKNTIYTVQ